MFGSLGTVSFQVINSPQRMRVASKYAYEKLAVIRGRPALQWIYDDLEQMTLEFFFSQEFTDPETAEDALEAIAEAHQIVPLVFGNGEHQGSFVVTDLTREDIWRADDGTAIAIQMTAQLLEWGGTLPVGAPSDIPTSTPGLFANGQPQTALYAGVNQVPPAPIPAAPAGMDATNVDSDTPMFPTYPILPYVPSVGQLVQQQGGFASVSLSFAARWGLSSSLSSALSQVTMTADQTAAEAQARGAAFTQTSVSASASIPGVSVQAQGEI
jgi:phage protein U